MSQPKPKLRYRKFTVRDSSPADTFAAKPTAADSALRLDRLEKKYRASPVQLVKGKSKVVAKEVVGKPGRRKAATDAARPMPTKKAFYLGGKVVAFQG
jgi:hypothetical protein